MVGISISLGLKMLAEIDRITTEMKFLHKSGCYQYLLRLGLQKHEEIRKRDEQREVKNLLSLNINNNNNNPPNL